MPRYEFECKCGVQEKILSYAEFDEPQICPDCLETMVRKISVPVGHITRRTGNQMALDTLNSKGGATPNKWYKPAVERAAAAGL